MDFETYVRGFGPRLHRLAVLLCDDPGTAEDVVQEVLLRAHHRWAHIQSVALPHAYVRRMVVNEATSWRRRWGRIETRPDAELDSLVANFAPDRDAHADLVAAISGLPPKQRAAIVLRYYEDLSYREIADALACRVTSVRGYVHRALKTLRIDIVGADDTMFIAQPERTST